ncbi:MAG TPA: Asp-tRNA(Asn)/Glu-tRNA(Gln) amidotransferase subunit GatC [Candidatus Paceibacterota bacterium]|nr:Asp-tRNA(Asn)/Glu-tRNA(Gln) amidotransferase subunit GatC [Candidatus Paceibacterota bacterium]
MKREDIEHLAKLSRIALSDAEADSLAGDISKILAYVGDIEKATGAAAPEKKVGPLNTVMREDGEPHESGIYTDALLKAAPERQGPYVKVKKILGDKTDRT